MIGSFPDAAVHHFTRTPFGEMHSVSLGSGPPFVLLHSVGCSAHEYLPVMAPLSDKFTVFATDLIGHGDSAPATTRMSIEDHAAAVLAWADAMELDPFHLSGASISAFIALAGGASRPERVRALSLVEGGFLPAAAWQASWETVESTFAVPTQTLEQVAPRFRKTDEALLRRWNVDRNKAGSGAMMAAMWAIRRYDPVPAMRAVVQRVLLLYGDRSPVLGALDRARGEITRADATVLENCGHFPMIDDPDGFVRSLVTFDDHVLDG